ncbi:hypothetical protein ACEYYA_01050 [Paracoccus sp. p3-h83]|uniref:hypothetical protein n=1 Tax=Paracoccus sp. p3-h83 TaxID=3342805 RepID=UPI0035B8E394
MIVKYNTRPAGTKVGGTPREELAAWEADGYEIVRIEIDREGYISAYVRKWGETKSLTINVEDAAPSPAIATTTGKDAITPKQIALIKRLGGEYHPGMSKRDASALIDDLLAS